MIVNCAEIMHLNPYKFFWYKFFPSAHIQSECTESGCYTACSKLSSLSCLIVFKLSNTHKFMLKTWVKKTVSYVCEGKQLGKKLHIYFRSVWEQQYTVNESINPLLSRLFWGRDSEYFSVLISDAKDWTVSMLFAQMFTMALELLHRCCLQGGNLQIKGL